MRYSLLLVLSCALVLRVLPLSAAARAHEKELEVSGVMLQAKVVSGRVTDSDGQPLVGATVQVVNLTTGRPIPGVGAYTDADGRFRVEVADPANSAISISYVGYGSVRINATESDSAFNITLNEEGTTTDDIVITGFGTKLREDNTMGITTIKGESFANMPIQNIGRGIQGRASGVQVTNANGIPGGFPQIRIRGVGSINAGNDPLYIIDGVRVTGNDRTRFSASSSILNGLNPNDVETITILKDPAAVAPYGAQGANGVVIITTKKGKAGVTNVDVSYSIGTLSLIRDADVMNADEYFQYFTEAVNNTLNPSTINGFNNTFAPNYYAGVNVDHVDAYYRNGLTQEILASVSGGNEKTSFLVSTSYNSTDAHVPSTKFERGQIRMNLETKANDWLTFDVSLNIATNIQVTTSFLQGGNFVNSPERNALLMPPVTLLNDANGNPLLNDATFAGLWNYENELANLWTVVTNSLIGSYGVNLKLLPWLSTRTSVGLDYSEAEESRRLDPFTRSGGSTTFGVTGAPNGQINESSARDINYQIEHVFNLAKQFGVHSVSGIVGFNYRNNVRRFFGVAGQGLTFPTLTELSNTTTYLGTPSGTGSQTQWSSISYIGQGSYNYNQRYYFTAGITVDGSSRFGANNRYGYFPAFSGAVRFTKEPWFPQVSWLNELKLRGSWGESGNGNIGNFAYLGLAGSAAANNYNGLSGTTVTSLANADLRWETNVSYEFALEFGILDNRISGSVGFYYRKTEDMLFTQTVASQTAYPGDATVTANIASMRNRGWEFEAISNNFVGKDFTWSTEVNFTYNQNRILDLPNGDDIANGLFEGRPYGVVRAARYAGVNPADGRAMFYDAEGNITYFPTLDDDQFIWEERNSIQPVVFGGMNNHFGYKGFRLSLFAAFAAGEAIFRQDGFFNSYARSQRNMIGYMNERWTTPGQVTGVPRAFNGSVDFGASSPSTGGSGSSSSALWEDGSWIRLRQIELSYTFPKTITDVLRLRSLRLFAQGVNLFTYTKYQGLDPELTGADASVVPQSKSIVGGIQIGL